MGKKKTDYKSAGVDIEAGNVAVDLIKDKVKTTFSKNVLTGIGSFGSLFSLRAILKDYEDPVMVQSIDGIQVKIKRVSDTGRHKVIDAECSSGNIKILANSSTQIPSGSAHITFDQKYTYAYGDNWIIE